jgi:hypothetical protein
MIRDKSSTIKQKNGKLENDGPLSKGYSEDTFSSFFLIIFLSLPLYLLRSLLYNIQTPYLYCFVSPLFLRFFCVSSSVDFDLCY